MSGPTRRHGQQLAAATLANLLTVPAPEMWAWRITYDLSIEALAGGESLDRTRVEFHAWAAVLDDAVWGLRDFPNAKRNLSLTGTFQGVRVHLWTLLPIPDGVTVAELSAPPQVDAPAPPDMTATGLVGMGEVHAIVPGLGRDPIRVLAASLANDGVSISYRELGDATIRQAVIVPETPIELTVPGPCIMCGTTEGTAQCRDYQSGELVWLCEPCHAGETPWETAVVVDDELVTSGRSAESMLGGEL